MVQIPIFGSFFVGLIEIDKNCSNFLYIVESLQFRNMFGLFSFLGTSEPVKIPENLVESGSAADIADLAEIEPPWENGFISLKKAAEIGDLQIFRFLLEKCLNRPNPNFGYQARLDNALRGAYHYALDSNNLEIMNELIQHRHSDFYRGVHEVSQRSKVVG